MMDDRSSLITQKRGPKGAPFLFYQLCKGKDVSDSAYRIVMLLTMSVPVLILRVPLIRLLSPAD